MVPQIDGRQSLDQTCERRCQLYRCWRSMGSPSTVAGAKPRLMNQCAVRVVSTNSSLSPAWRGARLDALEQAFAVAVR